MRDVGGHFDSQYQEYLDSIFRTNRVWYRNINRRLRGYLRGTVLDVGNGGVFTYDTRLPDRIIAVDVAFRDKSKLRKWPNVTYVCDDARHLRSVPDSSVDTVIFQFVLHHVVGVSSKQTMRNLEMVMASARRVLRKGGRVVVVETFVPGFAEAIERFLYPLTSAFLRLLDRPMILLISRKTCRRLVLGAGFREVREFRVSYGKKIDILNGLKPGILVVPAWLAPHRCYLLAGRKSIR